MAWFTDIRKIAFLACITVAASLIMRLWNDAPSILATASQPDGWRVVPMGLLPLLPPVLLIAFYFALYRDEGTGRVSDRLRFVARTSAFITGMLLAWQSVEWIKSPATPVSDLLNALASIANILLLAALSRDYGDELEDIRPVSVLLYVATKVTGIVCGIWLALYFLRLLITPYFYYVTRNYVQQFGQTPPPLQGMMVDSILALVFAASLFVAPFIVYKSRVRVSPEAHDTDEPEIT